MTGIGGPGGIGGPKGPTGPDALDAPDAADQVADVGATAPTGNLDALAADIAAGKLTPQQAVDKLVDEIAGTKGLDATERAELKELMSDLIANDPQLAALVGRV